MIKPFKRASGILDGLMCPPPGSGILWGLWKGGNRLHKIQQTRFGTRRRHLFVVHGSLIGSPFSELIGCTVLFELRWVRIASHVRWRYTKRKQDSDLMCGVRFRKVANSGNHNNSVVVIPRLLFFFRTAIVQYTADQAVRNRYWGVVAMQAAANIVILFSADR